MLQEYSFEHKYSTIAAPMTIRDKLKAIQKINQWGPKA